MPEPKSECPTPTDIPTAESTVSTPHSPTVKRERKGGCQGST